MINYVKDKVILITGGSSGFGLDDSWQTELPDAVDFARTLVHCIDVPHNSFIEEVRIWGTAQVPGKVNPL